MIRLAKPNDIDTVTALGIEALSLDAYDELLVSPERVRNLCVECVSSASHFAQVSETDGEITGALVVYNSPMELYERNSANILMWYDKNGNGMKLFAEFMSWFSGRRIIKQIQYMGERGGDPRILHILQKRYGFRDDVPHLYLMR